jgi:uncharacterized integral membrane protein
MKMLHSLILLILLLVTLVLSLLLVVINSDLVYLDIFGLFFVKQSLGLIVLFSFVLGVLFTLALTFIPSSVLSWRHKRLAKKSQK